MDNANRSNLYVLLTITWLIIFVNSCRLQPPPSQLAPTQTVPTQPIPTQPSKSPPTPTSEDRLTHFSPDESFPFGLEFDYPANWTIKTIDKEGDDRYYVFISGFAYPPDPGEEDLSLEFTPSPGLHDEPVTITFILQTNRPEDYSLDVEIDDLFDARDRGNSSELIADRAVEIDGYPARWITMRKLSPPAPPPTEILEDVFLMIDNQLYIIGWKITEDDKYGELVSVLEVVIESIKVIPPE